MAKRDLEGCFSFPLSFISLYSLYSSLSLYSLVVVIDLLSDLLIVCLTFVVCFVCWSCLLIVCCLRLVTWSIFIVINQHNYVAFCKLGLGISFGDISLFIAVRVCLLVIPGSSLSFLNAHPLPSFYMTFHAIFVLIVVSGRIKCKNNRICNI